MIYFLLVDSKGKIAEGNKVSASLSIFLISLVIVYTDKVIALRIFTTEGKDVWKENVLTRGMVHTNPILLVIFRDVFQVMIASS